MASLKFFLAFISAFGSLRTVEKYLKSSSSLSTSSPTSPSSTSSPKVDIFLPKAGLPCFLFDSACDDCILEMYDFLNSSK